MIAPAAGIGVDHLRRSNGLAPAMVLSLSQRFSFSRLKADIGAAITKYSIFPGYNKAISGLFKKAILSALLPRLAIYQGRRQRVAMLAPMSLQLAEQ
ncbi:hypothetical protein ACFSFZ_16515 [Mixta tenebrionis]|uniref:Uncharacterized protein n=1 Tax=Mixta tenebrionis TaxID=2562439 RepID=A0A506V6Y8_9GAMM|nr:hypothetical protein [Mixta tenebrionis]TPW41674.1 hypothetical protein FKM52_13055 [Mixta tenebrionis]